MINEKIARYHSLGPNEYPILERMELRQSLTKENDVPSVTVQITLRPTDNANQHRLILCFAGVRDFCFKPFTHPFQFTALDVASMQDRQWEQGMYWVANAEQDAEFKFFCLDFTAEVL